MQKKEVIKLVFVATEIVYSDINDFETSVINSCNSFYRMTVNIISRVIQ